MDMKYTKERIEEAAKVSNSIAGVMRELGINKPSGGTYNHISRRLREWEIDTTHFLGQGSRLGQTAPNRKPPGHFLTRLAAGSPRTEGRKLKRALLEVGRLDQCEDGRWCPSRPGPRLQVHHRDGDYHNNQESNLALLCPGCHDMADQELRK
jgi:hypothetical protein